MSKEVCSSGQFYRGKHSGSVESIISGLSQKGGDRLLKEMVLNALYPLWLPAASEARPATEESRLHRVSPYVLGREMIINKADYDDLQVRSDIVRYLCVILKVPQPKLFRAVQKMLEENRSMYARIHKIKVKPYKVSGNEEREHEV